MNGGAIPERFPTTRHSVVRALRGGDSASRERAFATLAATYWRPVYKYLRLRWTLSREDAEDLTQEFFSATLTRDGMPLSTYDPARARFRTFLRTCVDRAVIDAQRAATRIKRGGAVLPVSADFLSAEDELRTATTQPDLDELFRQEWIRALFELAVSRLREECERTAKHTQFAVFRRYDIEGPTLATPPTYSQLGAELNLPETQVTNYLAFARRRLRHHVLEALDELTASDEEMADEAREIFGVERT